MSNIYEDAIIQWVDEFVTKLKNRKLLPKEIMISDKVKEELINRYWHDQEDMIPTEVTKKCMIAYIRGYVTAKQE